MELKQLKEKYAELAGKMKNYEIYIKSHAEAPDYEDMCEAESLEEASKIFEMRIGKSGGDVA